MLVRAQRGTRGDVETHAAGRMTKREKETVLGTFLTPFPLSRERKRGERKRGSGKGDKSNFVGSLGRSLFLSQSLSGAQRELQAELLGGALLPDLVSERAAASNRPAHGVQLAFGLNCVYQTNPIPRTRYRPVAQPHGLLQTLPP